MPARRRNVSNMLWRSVLAVILLISITESAAVTAQRARPKRGWRLLWRDEFSAGSSPSQKKWSFELGDACQYLSEDQPLCGWGNGEMQFYTGRSENARVEKGHLVIEARREVQAGRITSLNNRFTSARIKTEGHFSVHPTRRWKTIKVEARIKIPQGTGLWPAFWMLPTFDETSLGAGHYGRWAASGEIDIMEAANSMSKLHGTIHYGNPWPANQYASKVLDRSSAAAKGVKTPYANHWHTYGIEWEGTQIRWYVDGVLYSKKNSASTTQWGWFSGTDGAGRNAPFDRPFYIILNMAVGGGFVNGDLGREIPYNEVAATLENPKQMRVDWVRVYGRR